MSGPSSIIGACGVRVSRLDADGTPTFANAQGAFVMCGGISKFKHDFKIQTGEEIYEEDACGNAVVMRKRPDKVQYVTFELTMAKSDYRLDEILGVATVLFTGPTINGRAFKASATCDSTPGGNGVSIELFSEQWDCDNAVVGAPYMNSILPRARLTPSGYERAKGVAMPVYSGYTDVNNNWGDGPFGQADQLVGVTDWLYAEIDATALPACASPLGYVATPPAAS